jgi:hypothetical protein
MSRRYQLSLIPGKVKDEESVRFHIKSGDYFGTIASVLSLIRQDLEKSDPSRAAAFENIFRELESDLIFLQKEYEISKKSQTKARSRKSKRLPKGKLTSQ